MHYIPKYEDIPTKEHERRVYVDDSVAPSKQTSLISLIIPVYQEEKLIESQLLKFPKELRKKYNFELIVSDGGSTDRTVEISRKYADLVVVHSYSYRQTISEGRNRGAEASKGGTLVFLNADSYPENIEEFFKFIRAWANLKNDDTAALACYVSGFPEEIILKDKIFYTLHNGYVSLLNSVGMGMGRGECQIVRRGAFFQVGGYNNSIVAGEDFDLYRRINKVAKVRFAKELVVLESPRRFRKYGYIKTIWYWSLNSITVIFYGKSVSKEWEAVR